MKKFLLPIFICLVLIGCRGETINTGSTTKSEMEFTEANQERLTSSVPSPKLNTSLERKNLVKYLKYFNKENRLSYIYLFSDTGAVLGYYNIVGKITYCRSKLTTQEQIVSMKPSAGNTDYRYITVESPGLDGTYGPSEDAIFFFTVQNPDVPVVYKGKYLVSGVPLSLSVEPIFVANVTPGR